MGGITALAAKPITTSQPLVCGAAMITAFLRSSGKLPFTFQPLSFQHMIQNNLPIVKQSK